MRFSFSPIGQNIFRERLSVDVFSEIFRTLNSQSRFRDAGLRDAFVSGHGNALDFLERYPDAERILFQFRSSVSLFTLGVIKQWPMSPSGRVIGQDGAAAFGAEEALEWLVEQRRSGSKILTWVPESLSQMIALNVLGGMFRGGSLILINRPDDQVKIRAVLPFMFARDVVGAVGELPESVFLRFERQYWERSPEKVKAMVGEGLFRTLPEDFQIILKTTHGWDVAEVGDAVPDEVQDPPAQKIPVGVPEQVSDSAKTTPSEAAAEAAGVPIRNPDDQSTAKEKAANGPGLRGKPAASR